MSQIADILYKGMTTSPDYKQSEDGDAALLVNMECTPYGLRPSQVNDTPVIEKEGFYALYLHRLPDSERCNIIGVQQSGEGVLRLSAFACDELSKEISLSVNIEVSSLSVFDNWACVGNVVSFTQEGRLWYLFYGNGAYRLIDRLPPYLPIEFACKRVLGDFFNPDATGGLRPTNKDAGKYCATMIGGLPNKVASVDIYVAYDEEEEKSKEFDPYYVPIQSYLTDANQKADNVIFGVLNSGLEIARSRGELVFPRLVRYAIKLTTGNQYMQYSPPILLFPREDAVQITGVAPVNGKFTWNDVNGENSGLRIWCENWVPQMRLIGSSASAVISRLVTEYKDLVEGIDIYMSAPIYTINFEHVLARRYKSDVSDVYFTKPYFAKVRNFDKIPELSEMFLLRHIPLSELSSTLSSEYWSDVMSKEEYGKLKTLQNRPAMPVNSYANRAISAGVVYAANSRFVLGDVTEELPQSYMMRQMAPRVLDVNGLECPQQTVDHPYELCNEGLYKHFPQILSFAPDTQGLSTLNKVTGMHPQGGSYASDEQTEAGFVWLPIYYTYPDSYANKLLTKSIYPGGTEFWEIPLKQSTWDNMSYAFAKKDDPNIGAVKTLGILYEQSKSESMERRHPNTVKMGDVGSPLFFSDGNSLQVGSGRVTAIASNSMEVSQGMYGQYNLVAFATDGISVLTLNGDGTFNSPVSIGTDIVKGMNQVGNVDTTIVAVANTGIIVVEGSSVQHILSFFPGIDESWKKNAHLMKVIQKHFVGLPDIKSMDEYFKDAMPMFDSRHDRLFVFSPKFRYSYVWNVHGKMWSISTLSMERRICVPGKCLVASGDSLYDLSQDGGALGGLYISRAIKIDSAQIAKRVVCVHQRGTAVNKKQFSGKVLLYSNAQSDLVDTPVASGEGYKMHSYGLPWPGELHRIVVFVPTWSSVEDVLNGCTIRYQNYLNRTYP